MIARVVASAALVACATSLAAAAPATTVFPLSARSLPTRMAQIPEELSRALANEIEGTVAKVPIDDAALLLECDAEESSCLSKIAKQYRSERIVFGSVVIDDDEKLSITITRYDLGNDRDDATYTVEGDVDDMAKQLVRQSRPLFGGAAPVAPGEGDDDGPALGGGPARRSGSISGSSWAILGSGVLVTGVGVGFWLSAKGIENDIKSFPTMTREDFERLTAYEDKGSQRLIIGQVLTVVGAAAIVYGVVRAVQDRRTPEEPTSLSRFSPMLMPGGGGMAFTLEWP